MQQIRHAATAVRACDFCDFFVTHPFSGLRSRRVQKERVEPSSFRCNIYMHQPSRCVLLTRSSGLNAKCNLSTQYPLNLPDAQAMFDNAWSSTRISGGHPAGHARTLIELPRPCMFCRVASFSSAPLQRFKSRVSICRDRMTPATSWHRSRTAPPSCFPGNSQSHSTHRLSYRTCRSRACSRRLSKTSRTVSWTASKPCCQRIMDPCTLCPLELSSNQGFQSGTLMKATILLNQAPFWFPSIPLHPQPRLLT